MPLQPSAVLVRGAQPPERQLYHEGLPDVSCFSVASFSTDTAVWTRFLSRLREHLENFERSVSSAKGFPLPGRGDASIRSTSFKPSRFRLAPRWIVLA